MSFINKYLRNFKPYKVASHKIWNVSPEERKEILKLDWNEAAIPPTHLVKENLMKLTRDGAFYQWYPSTYNEKLLDLLAGYTGIPKENIQYFGSSDSLHEYIAKMYIGVGDPIVIVWPSYDNFRLTAEVNGADIHFFEMGSNFELDEAALVRFIEKTEPSFVYICNPNNPTGICLSNGFIESLLDAFSQTMFLIDEAYCEFSGASAGKLVLEHENIIISRTMSKAFALANFRFGYMLASKDNIEYISTIRNPKNISTFSQAAAMSALQDIPYMLRYVEQVREARDWFASELKKLKSLDVFAGEGNFVMLRFQSERQKMSFIEYLRAKNIFVRDLRQDESLLKCVRITVGTKEQMSIVLREIKSWGLEGKGNESRAV